MLLRSVRRLAEPRPYAIHASIQIVCLTLRISYTSFWSELPVQRCACVTACHAVYVWVCVSGCRQLRQQHQVSVSQRLTDVQG